MEHVGRHDIHCLRPLLRLYQLSLDLLCTYWLRVQRYQYDWALVAA